MATEQLITKIVDGQVPTIQATVEANGLGGLLLVKAIDTAISVSQSLPTEGQNAEVSLTYNTSGQVETITKIIGGVSYSKTLTYTNGVLTNISEWV
ncbi:MAG: hypothetical protein BWY21_02012 [Parcubacteria group bacterium ADurb.Bin216]|nr:MAG: hypothetical protein BWY21_02012 [Parcubacteria group bacterium ADurb.Bin216]